jgi:hypothetical protein
MQERSPKEKSACLASDRSQAGLSVCAVRVVPGQDGMKVVGFGPLKLLTGQLPEWAR